MTNIKLSVKYDDGTELSEIFTDPLATARVTVSNTTRIGTIERNLKSTDKEDDKLISRFDKFNSMTIPIMSVSVFLLDDGAEMQVFHDTAVKDKYAIRMQYSIGRVNSSRRFENESSNTTYAEMIQIAREFVQ